MNIEVFARAIGNQLVGYEGIKPLSMMGFTSLWMFLVGGLCGILIGSLNEHSNIFGNLKMWQQVILGGTIITLAELFSGIILNIYLGLHIWDYSSNPYNFMGQIELQNCIWWYVLPIIIIWLDDALSCYFYEEEKPPSLLSYFIKLVKLQ